MQFKQQNYSKVSVITVCYNSAKTIEQTIKSVINQTYFNIEYIIIDGGSTDDTVEIIRKYNKNISYWISEPDKGIYDAMNKGISVASGDVIGILNADDYYGEYTVEAAIKNLCNSTIDIVHGDLFLIDTIQEMRRLKPIIDLNLLRSRMSVYHPTLFIKKHCYDKFGAFDDSYKLSGDYELILRLFLNGNRFLYDNNIVAYYRNNGASFRHALIGLKEVRDISIKYGYNKALAYSRYYYILAKYKLKAIIDNK